MENNLLNTQKSDEISKRAFGCLFGAIIGDASGAPLEKLGRNPLAIETSMLLNGGGSMRLAPGQCTDDGEMTISLARGLIECKEKFEIEKIAQNYGKWVSSKPFDMGITTGASIGCVLKGENNSVFKKNLDKIGYAEAMKRAAKFEGTSSMSNGSLMRCSPIGIYGYKLKDDEIAWISKEDSSLSHANKIVCDCVSVYCIAIAQLIKNGDKLMAFNRSFEWAKQNANSEVIDWMNEAKNNILTPYFPSVGWIKISFTHAFRHLLLGTNFKEALSETLGGGGDTDTNACIVGAMLGASLGIDNIPQFMIKKITQCDNSKGRPRPDFLNPKHIPEIVENLLALSPDSLIK